MLYIYLIYTLATPPTTLSVLSPDEGDDVVHLVAGVDVVALLAQLAGEGEDAHGVDVEGDEGPHHQRGPHDARHAGHHARLVQPPVVEEGRLVEALVRGGALLEHLAQRGEVLGVEPGAEM